MSRNCEKIEIKCLKLENNNKKKKTRLYSVSNNFENYDDLYKSRLTQSLR